MFKQNDIVKILLPITANAGFDYRLSAPAEIGNFVICTVLNRKYIGVVWGPGDGKVPENKIKSVLRVLPQHLSSADLEWIKKMSDWTMISLGAVLHLIINVPGIFAPPKTEKLYTLDSKSDFRMTRQRQSVADAFVINDNEPMTIFDIQNISHVRRNVIDGMVKSGILRLDSTREKKSVSFDYKYRDMGTIKLNTQQRNAANIIGKAIKQGGFSVFLLDGITGSGKTQVYFDSAWRAYKKGGSVLLMMPEISLTAQFMKRYEQRFGAPPVVWHSNLTSARRREIWRGVVNGEIRMVVGTRSALFLPWQNLSLIVVDEEHDTSYKQEDMGIYNARDMAVLRAKIANFPIILASATPSEETLQNVNLGKYKMLKLTSRFGGATLPKIETIDLRENKPLDYKLPGEADDTPLHRGFLSPTLCEKIQKNLLQHQQVMLFINRRGFAPIIQCQKCGWIAQCPNCSVGMTYHKRLGKMLCHMCGHTEALPQMCPVCGEVVSMRGVGLEKIQEEVSAKFPTARTDLVSSDTIFSRGALERLVSKMESGDTDIIIGTQILAKGHHFPNLTLVGVVDADMGLFGTDFRAAEHTFQQLFQVAGRAGRGKIPGLVLLQTYQPQHAVLRAICVGDRDTFVLTDLQNRKIAKMPPFGQLAAIIIEAQRESVLKKYCADLAAAVPIIKGAKIMGPIETQIYQIRNWFRMRFLIMGGANAKLQPLISHWLGKVKQPANVRVKIDINPQSFA